MSLSYYFEPYMVPVGLLLLFVKHYIVTSYLGTVSLLIEDTASCSLDFSMLFNV